MEGGGRERLEHVLEIQQRQEHLPRSESLRVRYAIGLVQTVLLLETLKPLPNMCFGLISSVFVQYAGWFFVAGIFIGWMKSLRMAGA
ncbi:MAG: hypothetical protein O6928_08475 [Gammaproteobacteria bacterium]|nr:hypothetical protein [Gammaproteobacteria bacterium]